MKKAPYKFTFMPGVAVHSQHSGCQSLPPHTHNSRVMIVDIMSLLKILLIVLALTTTAP